MSQIAKTKKIQKQDQTNNISLHSFHWCRNSTTDVAAVKTMQTGIIRYALDLFAFTICGMESFEKMLQLSEFLRINYPCLTEPCCLDNFTTNNTGCAGACFWRGRH